MAGRIGPFLDKLGSHWFEPAQYRQLEKARKYGSFVFWTGIEFSTRCLSSA